MVRTVLTVASVVVILAALWVARAALMLIYISAIIAMGFAPMVGIIQNPRQHPGVRRIPRTLAILAIYMQAILHSVEASQIR